MLRALLLSSLLAFVPPAQAQVAYPPVVPGVQLPGAAVIQPLGAAAAWPPGIGVSSRPGSRGPSLTRSAGNSTRSRTVRTASASPA